MWKGLVRELAEWGTIYILVRSPAEPDRLFNALSAAAADIGDIGYWADEPVPGDADSGLWEAAEVTGPIPVPGGGILQIHAGNTPPEMKIGDIPGLLAQSLELAGITDASVGPAPVTGTRYEILRSLGPAVRTVLCGPPPAPRGKGSVPSALTDAGVDWLHGESRDGWELRALLIAAEVPVTWETLRPVIDGGLAALPSVSVLATDFAAEAAAITVGECLGQAVAMTAARAGQSTAEIVSRMRRMRDTLRVQADRPELWLASVTVQPDSRDLYRSVLTNWGEDFYHPAWYQILSPERLRRIGGPPPGAADLPGGRVELTVGEPEQWLPGHPDHDTVRRRAAELLAGGGGAGVA
jgi:hypothetical protein